MTVTQHIFFKKIVIFYVRKTLPTMSKTGNNNTSPRIKTNYFKTMSTTSVINNSSKSEEVLDILSEMAGILETGLDRRATSSLVQLLVAGVNPESLAAAVHEIRRPASTAVPSKELSSNGGRVN
jgi:mitotic-spindle organizing protein 1